MMLSVLGLIRTVLFLTPSKRSQNCLLPQLMRNNSSHPEGTHITFNETNSHPKLTLTGDLDLSSDILPIYCERAKSAKF